MLIIGTSFAIITVGFPGWALIGGLMTNLNNSRSSGLKGGTLVKTLPTTTLSQVQRPRFAFGDWASLIVFAIVGLTLGMLLATIL